jgi:hypothetical protein
VLLLVSDSETGYHMRILRSLAAFVLIVVLSSLPVAGRSSPAAGENLQYSASDTSGSLLPDLPPTNLLGFRVRSTDSAVGDEAVYFLEFSLPKQYFLALSRGKLVFLFPEGFDLTLIEAVRIEEDYSPLDYSVDSAAVADSELTVYLARRYQDGQPVSDSHILPGADSLRHPVHIAVGVSTVRNPTRAGTYSIRAGAYNRHDRVVIPLAESERFDVIPGPVHEILVFPSEDLTLKAGETQLFSAIARDRFGNEVTDVGLLWSLTDSSDDIGEIQDGAFQARRVGEGRVVAGAGDVRGLSGLITRSGRSGCDESRCLTRPVSWPQLFP